MNTQLLNNRTLSLALASYAILAACGCAKNKAAPEVAAGGHETAHARHMSGDDESKAHRKGQGYIFPGLEHGLSQSPINIRSLDTSKHGVHHSVHVNYKKSHENVVNKGHTIEVDYDEGSSITFDGQVYDFKQFHFHTPSEHLVDGVTYPMEMHLVHTLHDNDTTYLVIGVLFKEGKRNKFLDEFISHIPKAEGQTSKPKHAYVDINDIFDGNDKYFTYKGSLTTPPYTETVRWGVLKRIHEASPEQIALFNQLEGNNARHIQAMNGRKVER